MRGDFVNPISTRQPPRLTAHALLPLGVSLGALVLYLCTLSKHFSEGEDSALYVVQITSPSSVRELFHPNHLAFNALNRAVFLVCRWVGYEGDASLPMQVVNVLAGSLALGIMVNILRRLRVDDRLTLCWVVATAVSYGFWSYSVQPETYILPLPLILTCIYLLIGLGDDQFSYQTLAWVGCLGAVATLIHQQHVLALSAFFIATAIIGYRNRSQVPVSRLVAGLGTFGLVAAVIVGVAYFGVAIGILHMHDLATIIQWSKGGAKNGLFYAPWSYSNPIQSVVVGFPRAVLGGHFLYGFDWFHETVTRRFPNKLLIEERFLAQALPPWVRLTCLAAMIVVGASVLAVARTLAFPASAEPLDPVLKRRYLAADTILIALICHYYIFNTVFEPANIEFWIALLPVVAIAMASWQARRPRAAQWWLASAGLAASLLVANGLGSVLPQTRLDTDYWYHANGYLIGNAKPGDIIITNNEFISNNYLKIYTKSKVISPDYWTEGRSPEVLLNADSKRVWISSWAFEPSRRFNIATKPDPRAEAAFRLFRESVRDRMVKRDDGPYQTVWELGPNLTNVSPAPK
jgi:hypothetical protein